MDKKIWIGNINDTNVYNSAVDPDPNSEYVYRMLK